MNTPGTISVLTSAIVTSVMNYMINRASNKINKGKITLEYLNQKRKDLVNAKENVESMDISEITESLDDPVGASVMARNIRAYKLIKQIEEYFPDEVLEDLSDLYDKISYSFNYHLAVESGDKILPKKDEKRLLDPGNLLMKMEGYSKQVGKLYSTELRTTIKHIERIAGVDNKKNW